MPDKKRYVNNITLNFHVFLNHAIHLEMCKCRCFAIKSHIALIHFKFFKERKLNMHVFELASQQFAPKPT